MTVLSYLEDFDVVDGTAKIVRSEQLDDERTDIVLDRTCFYPRGGGQDWDTGIIKGADANLTVEEVRLDENGDVHHIGHASRAFTNDMQEVSCVVDKERRDINTRLHSAGHVVDMAVDHLGLPWTPGKGAHYPHMSFVEYASDYSPEAAAEQLEQIQAVANELIAGGTNNEIRFMAVDEMHTVCRHVPNNIPTNKPARVVIYAGYFGVPCGGTHVVTLDSIGALTIPKIKAKKGVIKVTYALEGIG